MTKKRLLFCLCYLFSLLVIGQDVQQNFLDSLSGKFITQIKKQGKPKAWLITDKSIFRRGESIWFRGFLLNSVSHKAIIQNKYFFVDVVNEQDSVVSTVLLDAASKQLSSKISLPATIAEGYYWLRAYTSEIAELNPDNAFVKPIYVAGLNGKVAHRSLSDNASSANGDPVIKFYPEGGNIITGANSTVAFLITNPQGKPLATDGFVKDTRDSIVARFTSNAAGLGKFDLYASFLRRYKAFINHDGKQISYPLPSFNFFAGQIAVTKQASGNKILRVLLEDSIFKKNVVTYLIGVSRDSLCYAAIGHGQYELDIPEQKFPEGIATFYLFDKDGHFLSERSIYIKESNEILKAALDKNIYAKRDKVTLNVSITDANRQPVPALLSVSVADSTFIIPANERMFLGFNNSALINNSTLPDKQNMTDEEIDLIMLLNDSTYKNSNIVTSSTRNYDSLLFIKGLALNEKNRPAANKILTLFSNNNGSFFTDTTDNTGKFSFPVYYYPDSTQFTIDAKNTNESTANIKIVREPTLFPQFRTPTSLKHYFSVEPVFTNKYRNAYFDTTVSNLREEWQNEVIVKGKRKKELVFDDPRRVTTTSTIIAGDQLDERRSTGDIVLNVGGLHVMNGYLVINGLTAMKAPNATSEPLLLIDGVQAPAITSVSGESPVITTLNSINPKEIDFIEILKGPEGSNYGIRGGNGVIIVNMAHSSRKNFSTNTGSLQSFYAKGVSRSSAFPVINYDNKEIRSNQHFDNRSTIYWNGNIITGGEDHLNLTFFTADVPTTYKVTLTGITIYGDMVYKTLSFSSK